MAGRTSGKKRAARRAAAPAAVRSDARTLHVDFENVADTLICARNAGVIVDYETRTRILDNFSFTGSRCAHMSMNAADQAVRLQLVRAHDARPARDGAVLEFVYRPALDKPVTLRNWPILRCSTPGGAPGAFELKFLNDPVYGMDGVLEDLKKDRPRRVAIELFTNGSRSKGTYGLDVMDRTGRHRSVLKDLDQAAWMRFILHRHDGRVDLFAGEPERETYVETFDDILPGGEIYAVLLGSPDDSAARGAGYWDSFRVGRPLGKSGRVAPAEPRIPNVGVDVPVPPRRLTLGCEKHLLIDDWSIAETRNIRRTFHRPAKHKTNPLIVRDRPWEPRDLYLFGGVERTARGKYRMWYNSADSTSANRKNVHTCLATSDDGIRWEKPSLGICEYKGSRDNNIVIANAGTSWVFMNPDEPRPDFRYLAKIRHQGTQGWTSADGMHWVNHGVILPQSLDASTCAWDPVRKKYVASIKLGYRGRRMRGYAESDDFLHWTDTYLMADVDHLDVRGDQIYQMPIFRYESLYLGLCKMYHVGSSDTCDIQLAVSHNCMHWERPYRALGGPTFATKDKEVIEYPDPHTQPLIPTGPIGSWDFGNHDSPASVPIRSGDELRFYYGGRARSHSRLNPYGKDTAGKGGTIGLATLRLDGFVSADADASGGAVLTRPMRLSGSDLFVNADASGGRLAVEVVDAGGGRIRGFAAADARVIRGDKTRIRCGWKNRRGISSLSGKTVRLKFHLANASLYAFWCE